MRITDGRVGQTYEVAVSDCCVGLAFTSRLVGLTLDGYRPDLYLIEARFENGVVIDEQTRPSSVVMTEAGSQPTGPASPPSAARSTDTG